MIKPLLHRGGVLVFAGLLGAAQPVLAHEYHVGALTIDHPYAIETAATAQTGAGYMSIENDGPTTDRLLAVHAGFPDVSLHRSEIDANGVARMLPLDAVDLPAGQTVTLEPKGIHIMFMGLTSPLKEGDKFPATLVFQKAGEVPVEFHVMPRGSADMDHGAGEAAH